MMEEWLILRSMRFADPSHGFAESSRASAGNTLQMVSLALGAEPEAVYNTEVEGNQSYWVGQQILLVHDTGQPGSPVEEEIGAFHTGNANWALIRVNGVMGNNWVQPFPATLAGIQKLENFLLDAGLGTGAAIVEISVVVDIRSLTIVAGGVDVNGAIKINESIPLAKIVTTVDDPGEPTKVAMAISAVKAYFGVP